MTSEPKIKTLSEILAESRKDNSGLSTSAIINHWMDLSKKYDREECYKRMTTMYYSKHCYFKK